MSEAASDEYRDVIDRYLEGFNEQDLEALQETVSPDVVVHGLIGVDGDVTGLEEYGEWGMEMFSGIPDAHIELGDFFVSGNKVASRWTLTGTHDGDLFDFPATGEAFEISGVAIFRMEDGKIAEKWYQQDDLGMLQQTGIIEF